MEKWILRPWELNITVVRESGTAIHVQIAQKIILEIQSGRFVAGTALPGTHELASKIQVNRKTVILAYDELIAQGWLTSESKRGTFVSYRVLTIQNNTNTLSQKNLVSQHQLPYNVIPILSKRQMHEFIHFSDGLPDSRLIPFEMAFTRNASCLNCISTK